MAMKLLSYALSVGFVGASQVASPSAGHVSLAARDAVPQQLGEMMAASQASLAQAEAYYEKAVQKTKEEFSQMLVAQAKLLSEDLSAYAEELSNATSGLEEVVNATRAGMAEVHPATNSNDKFDFSADEQRSRLGAKADAAESESRHLRRKGPASVRQATAQVKEPLEDAAQQMSRKLGDLSPVVNDAVAVVEGIETKLTEENAGPTVHTVKNQTKALKHASLSELEQALSRARNSTASQTALADKKFAAALATASTRISAATAELKKALADSEKEEIRRVHAREVDNTPHHLRHKHSKRIV